MDVDISDQLPQEAAQLPLPNKDIIKTIDLAITDSRPGLNSPKGCMASPKASPEVGYSNMIGLELK